MPRIGNQDRRAPVVRLELHVDRPHAAQRVAAGLHRDDRRLRYTVGSEVRLAGGSLGVDIARLLAADSHDVPRDVLVVQRDRVVEPGREDR